MSARELLDAAEKLRAEALAVECANCGHRYGRHVDWNGGRCLTSDWVKDDGSMLRVNQYGYRRVDCRCKRFVDPAETLAVREV